MRKTDSETTIIAELGMTFGEAGDKVRALLEESAAGADEARNTVLHDEWSRLDEAIVRTPPQTVGDAAVILTRLICPRIGFVAGRREDGQELPAVTRVRDFLLNTSALDQSVNGADHAILETFKELVALRMALHKRGKTGGKEDDEYDALLDRDSELVHAIAAIPARSGIGIAVKAYMSWQERSGPPLGKPNGIQDIPPGGGRGTDGALITSLTADALRVFPALQALADGDEPAFLAALADACHYTGEEFQAAGRRYFAVRRAYGNLPLEPEDHERVAEIEEEFTAAENALVSMTPRTGAELAVKLRMAWNWWVERPQEAHGPVSDSDGRTKLLWRLIGEAQRLGGSSALPVTDEPLFAAYDAWQDAVARTIEDETDEDAIRTEHASYQRVAELPAWTLEGVLLKLGAMAYFSNDGQSRDDADTDHPFKHLRRTLLEAAPRFGAPVERLIRYAVDKIAYLDGLLDVRNRKWLKAVNERDDLATSIGKPPPPPPVLRDDPFTPVRLLSRFLGDAWDQQDRLEALPPGMRDDVRACASRIDQYGLAILHSETVTVADAVCQLAAAEHFLEMVRADLRDGAKKDPSLLIDVDRADAVLRAIVSVLPVLCKGAGVTLRGMGLSYYYSEEPVTPKDRLAAPPDPFMDTVAAFEQEAPAMIRVPVDLSEGFLQAGAEKAGISPAQARAFYSTMVEAFGEKRVA
ncbi:hypothetical protein [Azospirillum sp. SYSU D00513]|uniref:hypothetical protein n=1 Tax=Azospirillum sp. SYSU D00513 TaxID=2812561 RepID=UPI001A97BACF|nr:hypothetical protein [Azospirillum sp. SYSU D00513]